MNPLIARDLSQEEMSDFHKQLLKDCKELVKMSREGMGQYYDAWDSNSVVYSASIPEDKDDKEAVKKGQPKKMSVPLLYSQVQTFIAFTFSLYFQRKTFFELSGNNMKGQMSAKVAEALLERDLNRNQWSPLLYQFLLDIARFGIGVIKHSWVEEKARVMKDVPQRPVMVMGIPIPGMKTGGKPQLVEETEFQGNQLTSISPYRFYPDTRLPLTRFQEGEFCASEDEFTYSSLKQKESEGVYVGVDFIPRLNKKDYEDRGPTRPSNFQPVPEKQAPTSINGYTSTVLITEVQLQLIPSKYKVGGKPMGTENYPVKYVVAYANDSRVIRCEPLGYLHNKFTYDIGLFSPDQHKLLAECLAEMISQLQDVINWFINSHIASVRKTIKNQIIVDPSAIETKDLDSDKAYIRLKAGAVRAGVDKWLKQIEVRDVTTAHVNDAGALHSFMQFVTGINENMMGQFHGGRRSATEARNTSMASASRLILIAKLLYDMALEPLARKMLKNLRDGLSMKTFVKLLGPIPDGLEAFNGFVEVDKSMLIGEFDFEVFDGTLASQKQVIADTLEEVLKVMLQNPEAIPIMKLDPNKVFREMLALRGIKNLERFDLNLGSPPVQPNAPGPTAGASAPPTVPTAGFDIGSLISGGQETPPAGTQ